MPNPAPNPVPEKPGVTRQLTGFAGQAAVALLGVGAVAPFRAAEIVLTVTGQTVQMAGAAVYMTGLGVSWVGMQTGRPGDAAGDYAGRVYDKVRAWRTLSPAPPPHQGESVTEPMRAVTRRCLAEIKAKIVDARAQARAAAEAVRRLDAGENPDKVAEDTLKAFQGGGAPAEA